MSAVLSPSNTFSARLALASGVLVAIDAPSMSALSAIVGKLQPTEAANDTPTAAPAAKTPAPAAAGNASASTGTPAGAPPAASGSASAGEVASPNYNDVKDRVLKLSKVSRETAMGALGKFKGQNGQPADHANKLKLEDYAAFIAEADKLLGAASA